jgi:acetylornithine deacetylase
MKDYSQTTYDAVDLLSRLIATPSISREEKAAADLLEQTLQTYGIHPQRKGNNVWAVAPYYDADQPTLLLNAHLDTVRPVSGWQHDPFTPTLEDNHLYGLGANDCGGGLVSLLFAALPWLQNQAEPLPFNLIYLASAEEEVSGHEGIESVLPLLPPIHFAIVGEPTGLQPAIAEKGLMVVDAEAHGRAGHAAREEGDNAIYAALRDITLLSNPHNGLFTQVSPLLGPVKTSVTIIHAGTQHNVVPDRCAYTIDVRSNECYTNEAILQILSTHLESTLKPRSTRLSSSGISPDHPFVRRCESLGLQPFGSPTLSDQALMHFPSVKLGPGQSARSHTADEYIRLDEIEQAVALYHTLLTSPMPLF